MRGRLAGIHAPETKRSYLDLLSTRASTRQVETLFFILLVSLSLSLSASLSLCQGVRPADFWVGHRDV